MSRQRSTLAALVVSMCTLAAAPVGASAAEQCPNAAFRTGASAHLPDCRAYELVSPPFKNAGEPELHWRNPNGSTLAMTMTTATPEAEGFEGLFGFSPGEFYTIERTASGWKTATDNLPRSEYVPFIEWGVLHQGDFMSINQAGTETLWADRKKGAPDNSLGIFARLPNRSVVEIGPSVPPTAPPSTMLAVSETTKLTTSISNDGSHILFSTMGDHWPFDETEPGKPSLYEYAGTGNSTPMLVDVNNEGKLLTKCGAALYALSSPSGKTVIFGLECAGGIYARIDNGEPGARTVDISEPSKEDCRACDTEAPVPSAAHFAGASEDGSKVLFATEQPLLAGPTGMGLYEYDFNAPNGERVSRVPTGEYQFEYESYRRSESNPVISEDGSHLYFHSGSVLTATPNGVGETAEPGGVNLYVYERDASYPTGRLAFVTMLSPADLAAKEMDSTPNGDFLVFTSERDLTPDTRTEEHVRQIFEYDAQTGGLVRVSIGASGFNNNGNAAPPIYRYPGRTFPENILDSAHITRWSVSADGSYVVFESAVGLTPQSLDRKIVADEYFLCSFELGVHCAEEELRPIYANNIYEYHDGQVSLISDGQELSTNGSTSTLALYGTDESGDDVFFDTAEPLVGQDTDTDVDLYDARIGGGFPAPAVPQPCAGESCQGALSGAPTLLSPGSEFQAGGNPPLSGGAGTTTSTRSSTKCKRGYAKRQGKCVKSKAKKAKKAGNGRRVKR